MKNKNTDEIITNLENLNELLELGVISKSEFASKKAELLGPYYSDDLKRKKRTKSIIVSTIAILSFVLIATILLNIPSLGLRCLLFGHDRANDFVVVKEPNCVEDGNAVLYCNYCGKIIGSKVKEKTGVHKYVNGVCSICGTKDLNFISNTVKYKVRTLVELHVRSGPGTSYTIDRNLPVYSVVNVYEERINDGYTWCRIGLGSWIANDGTWLEIAE